MSALELIRKRRSVRTFDGSALRPEDAQKLLAFAGAAENPYGVPIVWRLLDAKENGLSSPVIVGADTYLAGKVRRVPHAEEAFGYTLARIVLFAASLGVGTTVIAGTMNRDAFERAMDVSDGEIMPCVSPLGYPAEKMSLREVMMRKGVRADSRLGFSELFFAGGFRAPLPAEDAGALRDALEAVRLAPSAVNRQPWRAVVCGDRVHFYEKRGRGYVSQDGWDMKKIDMGIALCHFALTAGERGLSVSLELADPGLAAGDDARYVASYTIQK